MAKSGATIGSVSRWALCLLTWLVPFAVAHAAELRVALVIGNSAYKEGTLPNPGNDARLVSQVLQEAGFTVIERRNVNQVALRRAIREFGDEIAKGGVGLFYYAGHGLQVRGRNYLIPIGHDIQRENEVPEQSVELGLVLEKFAAAKNQANIAILDACRNNPYGGPGGLAPVDAPAGTLIAFSTAPGQFAADGDGDNSTYTKHLAAYMREQGLKIEDVFKRTRTAVRQESRGRQVPWENTSLEGDFYFKAPDPAALADQQREREEAQKQAIERAVQAALKHGGAGDHAQIEREVARRVAAERAAYERAAEERIAAMERAAQAAFERGVAAERAAYERAAEERIGAIERAAQAAIERAMRGEKPPGGMQRSLQVPRIAAPLRAPAVAKPLTVLQPVMATEPPIQVAAAAPAGADPGMPASYTAPKVGDTWTYLRTDRDYGNKRERKTQHTVEAVTDSEIRIGTDRGGLFIYNLDGNLVRREGNEQTGTPRGTDWRAWEPFRPRFNHPLQPGKSWSQRVVVRAPNNVQERFEDTNVTVIGWENVTVPAGTFRALNIAVISHYNNTTLGAPGIQSAHMGSGQVVTSAWYAPQVKRFVKVEQIDRGVHGAGGINEDSVTELLSFKLQ